MQAVAWAAVWDGEESQLLRDEQPNNAQVQMEQSSPRVYPQHCFLSMELCRVAVMSLARAARC